MTGNPSTGKKPLKVLIIEDDREILELLSVCFELNWPDVTIVETDLGKKGIELVKSEKPGIVILDLGLPDTNGFDVLKEIRSFSDVPLLILTIQGEEEDVVKGLEWGADDYMVKPFRNYEFLSRVRAITRRTPEVTGIEMITVSSFRYNPVTRQLFQGDEGIPLTPTESTILYLLMKNAGQVVNYNSLAEAIWGNDYPDAVDSLRVYIRRLREKLESDPDNPSLILNKTRIGYMMVKPDQALR